MSEMLTQETETVLLVDDNPTNLQVLYQTLAGEKYKLLIARNGEDALQVCRKAQPVLILLDIMMPGIDGYETCRRIKADEEMRETSVIFLSALDDGHGAAFELSFSPFSHAHVAADLVWTELDVEDDGKSSSGPDLMTAFVGAGGHYSVLSSTDVYLDVGYAYEGLDSGCCGLGDDDNGGAVRAGVRSVVLPALELGARAAYKNVGGDSVGAGRLTGRWYFSNAIALALNLDYDSDEVFTLFSGLRLDFGRSK